MRQDLEDVQEFEVQTSRAVGRKRRMAKGLTRWHTSTVPSWRCPSDQDERIPFKRRRKANPGRRQSHRDPWFPVAHLTLTARGTPLEARDKVRQFFMALRDKFGELTYCWWIELTLQGDIHVHAMLVNPPRRLWRHSVQRWLRAQWGDRFVYLRGATAAWFRDKGADYALGYAKKVGDKAYQQEYDLLPREVRTFGTSLKEHTAEELAAHENGGVYRYVPQTYDASAKTARPPVIQKVADIRHEGHPCSLRRVTKSQGDQARAARTQRRLATLRERRRVTKGATTPRAAPCSPMHIHRFEENERFTWGAADADLELGLACDCGASVETCDRSLTYFLPLTAESADSNLNPTSFAPQEKPLGVHVWQPDSEGFHREEPVSKSPSAT